MTNAPSTKTSMEKDLIEKDSIVVAITGGIGSGKTAVGRLFEQFGAAIIDADVLARDVVKPGSIALSEIQIAFPNEALILADGSLNRGKLGEIIFNSPKKRKTVEAILHPKIRTLWLNTLDRLKNSSTPVIAYIVPLFFESGANMPEIKKVILVTAPEETRIKRIMDRDGFPREIAELRLRAQLPDSAKRAQSDFIITNDSTLEELRGKTDLVFKQITQND